MHKMGDRELRQMAIFKLRQVARQLEELEHCAAEPDTRGRLSGIRRAVLGAADGLQDRELIVVDGDDEVTLTLR